QRLVAAAVGVAVVFVAPALALGADARVGTHEVHCRRGPDACLQAAPPRACRTPQQCAPAVHPHASRVLRTPRARPTCAALVCSYIGFRTGPRRPSHHFQGENDGTRPRPEPPAGPAESTKPWWPGFAGPAEPAVPEGQGP